jgi:hypothetical protein
MFYKVDRGTKYLSLVIMPIVLLILDAYWNDCQTFLVQLDNRAFSVLVRMKDNIVGFL